MPEGAPNKEQQRISQINQVIQLLEALKTVASNESMYHYFLDDVANASSIDTEFTNLKNLNGN